MEETCNLMIRSSLGGPVELDYGAMSSGMGYCENVL